MYKDDQQRPILGSLFGTGWGRLAVVSWILWVLMAAKIVNENSYRGGWDEEHYIVFLFLVGILPPLVIRGILWVVKGFLDEKTKTGSSGLFWRPDWYVGPMEVIQTAEILADGVYSHLKAREEGSIEASFEIVGKDLAEAFRSHLKLTSFLYGFGLTVLRCEAHRPGFIESQSCARARELAVEKVSRDISAQGSLLGPELPPKREPRDAAIELVEETMKAVRQCLAFGLSSTNSPLFPLFKHLATTSCMWESDPQDPESLERDLGPITRILWKKASDLMGFTD